MASDSLFGVHGAALEVRAQRMGLLASNIANASTPGFKAKDLDFQSALAAAEQADGSDGNSGGVDLTSATKYRTPMQPSLGGHPVEVWHRPHLPRTPSPIRRRSASSTGGSARSPGR